MMFNRLALTQPLVLLVMVLLFVGYGCGSSKDYRQEETTSTTIAKDYSSDLL